MAAPAPTARQTPTGWKMPEGFKTLITFSLNPAVQLWEKSPKPPALDGGDAIMTTTMHNTKYHTAAPRTLIKVGDVTFPAAYDPDVIPGLLAMINVNQTITVTFPDHSTIAFFGWVAKFEPGDQKEGEFPEAAVTVYASNTDPATGAEAGPVFTPAAGT